MTFVAATFEAPLPTWRVSVRVTPLNGATVPRMVTGVPTLTADRLSVLDSRAASAMPGAAVPAGTPAPAPVLMTGDCGSRSSQVSSGAPAAGAGVTVRVPIAGAAM